jgi:hypothetical protein
VRYISYFEAFLNRVVLSPQVKYLRHITFTEVPITYSGLTTGCNRLFFEIYQVEGMNLHKIFSN